ncbi:hypothetical protein [Marinigracilibium pacificum]|uniref:Uncharacterized protein n=1 Tax=Marinigracilibium pacificum TaxID=2729599 RepID=A0A848J1J1_9BACT|nr:hypothetical protein [Marinigracilibium pacificum]NMM50683.1 hypothetical protein [Marinigracilibium pacificum]
MKRIHYISGITIFLFIAVHLVNHFISLLGSDSHINFMNAVRLVYRNIFVESILFLLITVQIGSGIILSINKWKKASTFFDRLQIWTGLYLALFFIIHVSAVLTGRHMLNLDTNIYFGVAGLNTFPYNLFFIPYYGLAIISFFGHISAIHASKMKKVIFGMNPTWQSYAILLIGIIFTLITLSGLTNMFQGIEIPQEYGVLIGK